MEVVIGVAVTIICACVVVEVIMSAKIGLPAGCCYALPEGVSVTGIIIEAVFVIKLKRRFMAEDEDVRLGIGSKLIVQPGLVYPLRMGAVLIETHHKHISPGERKGDILFPTGTVTGQGVSPCKDIVPTRLTQRPGRINRRFDPNGIVVSPTG